jgi:hypothetical protein
MLVSFSDSLRVGADSDFVFSSLAGDAEGDGAGAPSGNAVLSFPVNFTASAYSVPEGRKL